MTEQATNRHVLTGAGSGIGAALASCLHERGDDLVLVARSATRAADLVDRFPRASTIVADLASPGSLHGLGREVDGPINSLVHCAGVVDLAPLADQRLDDWQRQLDVNLTSPAMLTREFLPHLRSAGGTVVFVNSTAGLTASPTWSAYAASKFGLRALAESLRAEEASYGVRVSTVYPSRTDSPMQRLVHEQEGKEYDGSQWIRPETVADAIVRLLDLSRDATIPEITIRPGR